MERLSDWVLRHRAVITGGWLLLAVLGGVTAPGTIDRLTFDFSLPGEPSSAAAAQIAAEFNTGSVNPPVLLVAEGPQADQTATEAAGAAERALPHAHVISPNDAARLVSDDERVAVALVYPRAEPGPDPYAAARPALEEMVERLDLPEGTTVAATDFLALSEGESGGGDDRGLLIEILIGAAGATVVLLLVFGSVLAVAPLLTAAVSILGTLLALLGMTYLGDISFIVQFLVALIGLGVAIDYALLIVMRWREELAAGADNDEAVRRSLRTAGRSVAVSGVTVAISLAALVLTPAPFLRSIGIGGLLIPLFSVATALTLLPALLSLMGPRLLWPRREVISPRSRLWTSVGRFTTRRRWLALLASSGVLLAMAWPITGLVLGSPETSSVAGDRDGAASARAAHSVLDGDLPDGLFRPLDVVIQKDDQEQAARSLDTLDGVASVIGPTGEWRSSSTVRLVVVPAADVASFEGREVLTDVREVVGASQVAGSAAEDADFVHSTYVRGSWVVVVVLIATFLLLARSLRSWWLPVKALLLNGISLAAAFGVSVLIWQNGLGTELLFNTGPAGSITTWVPVAAFAFLFGLSMDYEVFILSRMREAYDATGDTDTAVIDGLAFTGRLVTSAAAILFFAFVALATVPTVEVKILATTLAVGIALDAVVVRGLLAPSLVAVLGERNWTLPTWLGRTLQVTPQDD